jgi:hypothetical protein
LAEKLLPSGKTHKLAVPSNPHWLFAQKLRSAWTGSKVTERSTAGFCVLVASRSAIWLAHNKSKNQRMNIAARTTNPEEQMFFGMPGIIVVRSSNFHLLKTAIQHAKLSHKQLLAIRVKVIAKENKF